MNKNTVTPEEVRENMQDVIVRTVQEFGKPTTYVTVQMKNGFTLRESTTCVDPANYNENIGKEICLKKIEDRVWLLLGYALQDRLASEPKDFKERLIIEHNELDDRCIKLLAFTESDKFKQLDEFDRSLLLIQYQDMSNYRTTLAKRMKRLGIKIQLCRDND